MHNIGINIQQNININNITNNIGNVNVNTNSNIKTNLTISKTKPELNKIYLPNNINLPTKSSNSPEGRTFITNNNMKINTGNPPTSINQNVGFLNTNINALTNNNIQKINIQTNNFNSHNNSNQTSSNSNIQEVKKSNIFPGSKGINIIPLKIINSQREFSPNSNLKNINTMNTQYNEKGQAERFSPKPKDVRIPANVSPKNITPYSTKNTTEKLNYGNKIIPIIGNVSNKSPSPKHGDFIQRLFKKSPDTKK